ncbi:pilus assembly protein TadG-related protein [Desulfovermiculus halophilus]|jgi:hypothetical protein|uniref:pilus assembly protein TadG-related protein n=1 Tax=Desulfovermiculus halophilus TaxID=339722 RepID=UPI000A029665|nr:pilus assembly protein TadG-related protein [Desulfovermiculus halophilus]
MLKNILTEYRNENQKGAVLIWVAVAMIALLGFAALAVDVGFLMAARNESQNAADAAALAGASELGRMYYDNGISYDTSWDSQIINVSDSTGKQNNVFGEESTIDTIQIGCWDGTDFEPKFNDTCPNGQFPNAVHVKSSGNNSSFFGKILDIEQLNSAAHAIASLSAKSYWEPGEVTVPIGISKYWFDPSNIHQGADGGTFCGGNIGFSPTGTIDGCAGFTATFDDSNSQSPSGLRKLFDKILNDEDISPEIYSGVTKFGMWGGEPGAVLIQPAQTDFEEVFDYMKTRDEDGDDTTWSATVFVYDWNNCDNPNKPIPIIGVTDIVIEKVEEHDIIAKVSCVAKDFRGEAGQWFGIYGTIPGLVE